MSASRSATKPAPSWQVWLHTQLKHLTNAWQQRSSRERRMLVLAITAVLALALWLLTIRPALNTLEQARTALPSLRLDAATVAAIALEAQTLKARAQPTKTHTTSAQDYRDLLQTALNQAGLATQIRVDTDSTTPSGTWLLRIDQATVSTLLDWLASTPATLGLQIQTLELQRSIVDGRERPGQVSGQLVLREAQQP